MNSFSTSDTDQTIFRDFIAARQFRATPVETVSTWPSGAGIDEPDEFRRCVGAGSRFMWFVTSFSLCVSVHPDMPPVSS